MKTLDEVFNSPNSKKCFDCRDSLRLLSFVPFEDLKKYGFTLTDEELKDDYTYQEFTRENILQQLEEDVAFGFKKALNKRGISSGLMFDVVMMWNWILEEGLEDFDESNYAQYGLPLFKATAVKYGFNNPIGDDNGDEYEYSSDYDD